VIIGECPYCKHCNMTPCADQCPTYSKEKCYVCGKEYWLRHSRLDPVAYPLDHFIVDEETKELKLREKT
jgi:hypothetical protein